MINSTFTERMFVYGLILTMITSIFAVIYWPESGKLITFISTFTLAVFAAIGFWLVFKENCNYHEKPKCLKSSLVTEEISELITKWDITMGTPAQKELLSRQFDSIAPSETLIQQAEAIPFPISPVGQRQLVFCNASQHVFEGKDVMHIDYGIEARNGADITYQSMGKVLIVQNESGKWRVIPSKIWEMKICRTMPVHNSNN